MHGPPQLPLLIITVAVALCFDFFNGFHDAANSIATVVSTRVLAPKLAVIWAALFNFLAAFVMGIAVAKTMGNVAGALFTGGYMTQQEMTSNWGRFHYPIIFGAYLAIALGTYFGGWRIVRTMGTKITKLKPVGGFCAETAAALTLVGTALYGIPVSTTHTITGAIVGVGSTQRISAVRWGVARRIVWAWLLTIPASAAVAALLFWIIQLIHPGA